MMRKVIILNHSLWYIRKEKNLKINKDWNNIKMYHLEDDIFLSSNGSICILKTDGFYDKELIEIF